MLIKSVLSSLPIYYMSLFKIPKNVAKELDRLQANFLWGGSEVRKKIHLIKWKEITMDKQKGGLGIRDIGLTNQCMLFKWWWRFALENDALWKALVCCKYGSAGGRWLMSTNIAGITSKI